MSTDRESEAAGNGAPLNNRRRLLARRTVISASVLVVLALGFAIGYGISVGGPLAGIVGMFPSGAGSSVASAAAPPNAASTPLGGAAEKPASGAWLKVSPENWDFGQVKATEIVTHTFQISNAGNGELKISSVTTSCGCTRAKVANNVLAPGASTEMVVTYNPGHHSDVTPGPVKRLIYIDSNDPSAPEIVIPVNAFVVAPAETPAAE